MNLFKVENCRWWLVIVIALGSWDYSFAQKEDYIWLTGDDSEGGYNSVCQCEWGITKFDFNQSPVAMSHDSLGIYFYRANSIVSDSSGRLLFYSNGIEVRNALDEVMQNGDSLGWGPEFTFLNPALYHLGDVFPYMLLTLPNPKASNIYDMFYCYLDSCFGRNVCSSKVMRSKVDINAYSGHGALLEKDVVITSLNNDLTIAATRHANGRDWWLCTNETSTNCHYIMLYNGDDSLTTKVQCVGANSPFNDAHGCRFSPDGSIYITANDLGQVDVFDFDRCNGNLNLREEFIIPEIRDSFQWWPEGLEFSPDSRFFYVFCSYRIFQFDLTASPIKSSEDTIATWHYPGHVPSDYFLAQLAPDGKIYVNGGSTFYYVSVIDSPDGKGSACKFLDQSLKLQSNSDGLPYNPNYRLGALKGSPCDTLTAMTEITRAEKEKILNVYPNPASDYVAIDYGFIDWNRAQPNLEICNALGQTIYTQALPMYSGLQKIDVSGFAAGMYTVYIKRNGGVVATSKLVKE